jgi:hypothetical protein
MFDSEKSIYAGVYPRLPKLFYYSIFDLTLRAGNGYRTIADSLSIQLDGVEHDQHVFYKNY